MTVRLTDAFDGAVFTGEDGKSEILALAAAEEKGCTTRRWPWAKTEKEPVLPDGHERFVVKFLVAQSKTKLVAAAFYSNRLIGDRVLGMLQMSKVVGIEVVDRLTGAVTTVKEYNAPAK